MDATGRNVDDARLRNEMRDAHIKLEKALKNMAQAKKNAFKIDAMYHKPELLYHEEMFHYYVAKFEVLRRPREMFRAHRGSICKDLGAPLWTPVATLLSSSSCPRYAVFLVALLIAPIANRARFMHDHLIYAMRGNTHPHVQNHTCLPRVAHTASSSSSRVSCKMACEPAFPKDHCTPGQTARLTLPPTDASPHTGTAAIQETRNE